MCYTFLVLVNMCIVYFIGYTVPKGWRVVLWFRSIHLDPEIYPAPMEFNPSRWDVSFNINLSIS